MNIEHLHAWLRKYLFREGVVCILVFTVAIMCVDVPGVVQSIKIRKLNDIVTSLDMSQLYDFSNGKIPASAVDWVKLVTYFRTILQYFPNQEDAKMFMGYCEYYGLGQEKNAFEDIRQSANNMPYYFWNVYDTGIFLFKIGDMDHAIIYLQLALLVPGVKMLYAMGNSIIYRQFFTGTLNSSLEGRFNYARENAFVLLAAAYIEKQNYDIAEIFAMKGVTEPDIINREPFYFYEGEIQKARGNSDKALSFFERAIKTRSKNPLVYQDAAEILKKQGRQDEAKKLSQTAQELDQVSTGQFPYPDFLKLEFF